jgi:hypothetical protein
MTTTAISSETVVLKGGFIVSMDALRLAWALEHRGCVLKCADDGSLFVGPRNQITPADVERIREHRDELLALVNYCETVQ